MSGPAHFIQFQASPALFPVSFTAITKDELSSLRKHVFSQTRYVDCVCTFTFSNKVLCQHKFYVFFNVRIIWLQSRWDFQCQDSTQATCVSGEEEEPVPCLWMSGYFLAKNLKTFLKSHHNSSDKKKQNKTKKNTTQIWRIWKNYEELKEKLNKVMTTNLHLHNIFHQCSSIPYTRKENWLHFITTTFQNTTSSPYYTAGVAITFDGMCEEVSIFLHWK